jgi:hypothetical protein
VTWRVKVKGERLLAAKFPLTVVAVVEDAAGTSARASTEVARGL